MPAPLPDDHAADVLRRAALLQARAEHEGSPRLSLDELKTAAAAAGIAPEFVEQAYLGAGEARVAAPSERFLGIPTGVQRVRVLPGAISDAEWGRIVLALRDEIGEGGTAEQFGDVREWRRYQTALRFEPEGETTRVTATGEWKGDAVATSLGSFLYAALALVPALLIAFGAGGKGAPVFAVLFALMAVVHAAFGWGVVRRRGPKRLATLDRALDAVERLAQADERAAALGPLAPAAAPTAPEAARLDPALLGDEPAADATPAPRQRLRE